MPQFGRYSSGNLLEGAVRTYGMVEGLKERKAGRVQRGSIAGRQQKIAEGQLKVSQDRLELDQEAQTAELKRTPVPERQFTTGEIANLKAMGGAIGKKLGFKLDTVTPIANAIEDFTAQGYKKIDVHRALKGDWGNYVKPAQESIQKAIETAISSNDKQTEKELSQLYTEISNPTFVDKMMPASARYEQDLQEAKKPKAGKTERLYPTKEGWQPRKDAIGKLQPDKKGGSSKMTDQEKRKKSLKDNYYKQIAQARSAAKNIDPLMKDIDVDVKKVQEDAMAKAQILADEYVKAGGKLEDLGLEKPSLKKSKEYKTADEVKKAYQGGSLTEKEAEKILQKQFGYK